MAKRPAGAGSWYVAPVVLETAVRLYTASPNPAAPVGPVLWRMVLFARSRYEFSTKMAAPCVELDGGELMVLAWNKQLVNVVVLSCMSMAPPDCEKNATT